MTFISEKHQGARILWPITTESVLPRNQSVQSIHVAGANAGKRLRASRNWFGFFFWLVEKVARDMFNQSQSVAMQNQSNCKITFDARNPIENCSNIMVFIAIRHPTDRTKKPKKREAGKHKTENDLICVYRLQMAKRKMLVLKTVIK